MIQTLNSPDSGLHAWTCVLIVTSAGALGGLINAFISDNGFALPTRIKGVLCPGALLNVLVGAVAAATSWALYGSGATIELASPNPREQISLRLPALAGALVVGLAGSKWLTNEADKTLLKQSVTEVAKKTFSREKCDELEECNSPRRILKTVAGA
jgi:hypothetical protein